MKIRDIRVDKGLTARDMAQALGISQTQYLNIERRGGCTFLTACKLADLLDVTLEELRDKAEINIYKPCKTFKQGIEG